LLLLITATVSVVMMVLKGFNGPWTFSVITCFRFILLFSYLVPISLRVNLDLSKIYYCKMIEKDKRIPGESVSSFEIFTATLFTVVIYGFS
jgi:phospholipid-translocating ATPase